MAVADKTLRSAEQLEAELKTLAGWVRDGIILSRDFILPSFRWQKT